MMTVNTLGGVAYVVTCSGACTVTANVNGMQVQLAKLPASGGQASFMAVTNSVDVSDASAMVLPYQGTDAPLGMGGGVTAEQVTEILNSALYDQSETQTRTAQGTDNYNASAFLLGAQHIPTGTLTAISIPCRNNSTGGNITYDPVYLTLQIRSASGGDNWEPLAVSTNTVVQAIGSTSRWEFDNIPLDGRDVRACLNTDQTGEWNTGLTMGLRVSSRPDGDTSTVGGAAYLADVTLTTVIYTEKFTSADHATDSTIHITDAERQAWNAKADASALATKVNSSTFTAHTGDTVAHLSSDEHTALTELIESGGGTITIDDTPKSGSSNAVSSGGVYNYLRSFNVALGEGSNPLPSSYNCSVSIGTYSNASGFASAAIGADAKSRADKAIAIGVGSVAEAESSSVLGSGGYIADTGVTVINAGGEITDGKSTQLYLIPAGSTMANTYTNGAAGLGYVVLDHLSGSVVARGTIPLASICTRHTADFSPTDVTSISDY